MMICCRYYRWLIYLLCPTFLIPGDVEGFGLVALEASMRGTYILASGIDGITDAVINKNGTLLPAGDAQAG